MEPGFTWIAPHTRIAGRVDTDGSLRIDGRIEGAIHAGEHVIVGPTGVVVTEIQAEHAEIRGVVIGNVVATRRIEVLGGARVVGDLRAPEIELAAGATIEGRVDRDTAAAPEPAPSGRPTLRARLPLRRPMRPGEAPAPAGPPRLPRLAARARLIPRRRAGDAGEGE